jgi:hypothetical protein
LTSAVAGGVAVADFLEAAAPSLARCAILTGARSELGGLLFSIVDFSESCRDGISFATADVATSSRTDAAMALKWYMIATSYCKRSMQDSSPPAAQKAALIEQPGIDDHVQGKRGSKGSPTEPAFACRATASTQNPHRGAASGWRVVSRDGDDYFEIAAVTIDKEWRRVFLLRFSPRVPQRHRVALVSTYIT